MPVEGACLLSALGSAAQWLGPALGSRLSHLLHPGVLRSRLEAVLPSEEGCRPLA